MIFALISNALEIKAKITDYRQNTRYSGSEISIMGVIYADISRMLTNSNTLKNSNRESNFRSEDDYRTPPRIFDNGRFWPFFGLKAKFGHI